jgi:hypothetical protein
MTTEEIKIAFKEIFDKYDNSYLEACMELQKIKKDYLDTDFYKATSISIEDAYYRCIHDDFMFDYVAKLLDDASAQINLPEKLHSEAFTMENYLNQLSPENRQFLKDFIELEKNNKE